MGYGLKVYDAKGNIISITPNVSNIISSGTTAMPDTLEGDGTYGVNIDLPGTEPYNERDIGVLINIRQKVLSVALFPITFEPANVYHYFRFLHSPSTYYTRNTATGVMTEFAEAAWADTLYSEFAHFFWDKMGATRFTSVRLFACVAFLCYDASTAAYKLIYRIDSITSIDYAVYLKNYNIV